MKLGVWPWGVSDSACFPTPSRFSLASPTTFNMAVLLLDLKVIRTRLVYNLAISSRVLPSLVVFRSTIGSSTITLTLSSTPQATATIRAE